MTKNATILITGGHVTPALAVIDAIRKRFPYQKIVCIGRTQTFEGQRSPSNEKRLMEEKKVRFIPIEAGRIQRFFDRTTILSLIKIPVGFVEGFSYLLLHRPDVILTFGGYVAVPVAIAGKILRIPIVTHEQTSIPGSGNRFIGSLAEKVCVSFPETVKIFPKEKAVMTGLPVRSAILGTHENTSVHLPDLPLIYITGGSTGASSVNDLIFPFIRSLVETHTVVHQTGSVSYEKARQVRENLPETLRKRYIIEPFFDDKDVSYFLHHARLVIARSGANSTAEILLAHVPAILIPLPWAGEGEQWNNARIAEPFGGISLFDQRTGTSDTLEHHIRERLRHTDRPHIHKPVFFAPPDAADRIVDVVETYIHA